MKLRKKLLFLLPALALAAFSMGPLSGCSGGILKIANTDAGCIIETSFTGPKTASVTLNPGEDYSLWLPIGSYSYSARVVGDAGRCDCDGRVGLGTVVIGGPNPTETIWVSCPPQNP